mmetsp:Transcript_104412/g.319730  ORF Transcript_104412/g.319730 Transcript_104412/m.319730 type:complete len:217 (+) Transcript_104412:1354-2004(+)
MVAGPIGVVQDDHAAQKGSRRPRPPNDGPCPLRLGVHESARGERRVQSRGPVHRAEAQPREHAASGPRQAVDHIVDEKVQGLVRVSAKPSHPGVDAPAAVRDVAQDEDRRYRCVGGRQNGQEPSSQYACASHVRLEGIFGHLHAAMDGAQGGKGLGSPNNGLQRLIDELHLFAFGRECINVIIYDVDDPHQEKRRARKPFQANFMRPQVIERDPEA